jgi:adenylate cyclase
VRKAARKAHAARAVARGGGAAAAGGPSPRSESGSATEDYGEAFVGNIGRRSLTDFTAIGDVVNVASRLQGEARGGEIVASARLVERLDEAPGERLELALKGKAEPVPAYRIAAQ